MTISDVAQLLGVSPHTIRYYEKMGLIRHVEKARGRRVFTGQDVKWMEFILRLKKTGMPLKQIKKYSDLRYRGDTTITERKTMLIAHRNALKKEVKELQSSLKALDQKIQIYGKMEEEHNAVEQWAEKT